MISRREDRSGSFLREFKSLGRNLFLIMYLGIISVALIVVLYRLDSYAEQLLVFFICWLISFHILLFVFRNVVSRRLIRATDYVYFLFVFIGLVMAAYAQQAERSETYMRLISVSWLWSQRRQDETPASAYLFLSNASLMAQILVSRNYPTDLFGLMPRDQKMHTLIAKYLVIDLWPFVLAFAIAIRITRVTSDVTGWPRDGKE